jgi:uncharacterized protein YjbJ (UPF0337 family)
MFITAQDNDIWRNWSRTRSETQNRWTALTPTDLDIIAGDRDHLIVRIVDRYGIAKVWAEQEVVQWESRAA